MMSLSEQEPVDRHRVFLSWSGERSKQVASAMRGWLPLILQSTRPWFSGYDIKSGAQWSAAIGKELEESQFGIICLTPENLEAPWLHFEAGALAKSVQSALIVPYLFGFEQKDLEGPLAQFQAERANKEGTWQLIQTINRELDDAGIREDGLKILFDALWPNLASDFKLIEDSVVPHKAADNDNVVQSVLDTNTALDTRTPGPSRLEETIQILIDAPRRDASASPADNLRQRVVLVHDRDGGMKEEVARFLTKLGTVALILKEQAKEARVTIEDFDDLGEFGYAVILMTADDIDNPTAESLKARINLFLALDYSVAKLGRNRVCVLYRDDNLGAPGDFLGVLCVKLDQDRRWQIDLARDLKISGIPIDFNKVLDW